MRECGGGGKWRRHGVRQCATGAAAKVDYGASGGACATASARNGGGKARGRTVAIDRTSYTALIARCTSCRVVITTSAVGEIKGVKGAECTTGTYNGGTGGAVEGGRTWNAGELADAVIARIRRKKYSRR